MAYVGLQSSIAGIEREAWDAANRTRDLVFGSGLAGTPQLPHFPVSRAAQEAKDWASDEDIDNLQTSENAALHSDDMCHTWSQVKLKRH
jgi:hypothetical protein